MEINSHPDTDEKKFYGGLAIFFAGLTSSFVGIGYMLYNNYLAIGKVQAAKLILTIYLGLGLVVIILAIKISDPIFSFQSIAILVGLVHYFSNQRSTLKNNESIKHQSFFKTLLVSLLSLVSVFVVIVILTMLIG